MSTLLVGGIVGVICVGCFLWAGCIRNCRSKERSANQTDDIFNISSQVTGEGPWPTHNAHIPVDHLAITNELNKYNDAPPSYEEAMRLALAASTNPDNDVVPAVVPKDTN